MKHSILLFCIALISFFEMDSAFAQLGELYNSPVPVVPEPTPPSVPAIPPIGDTISGSVIIPQAPKVDMPSTTPMDTEIKSPLDNPSDPFLNPLDTIHLPPVTPILPPVNNDPTIPSN